MSDSPGRNKLKDVLTRVAPYLGGALFLIALLVLRHTLRKYHYHEIIRHIRNLPPGDIALALALTAAGYLVLTGYDAISIHYIRRTLPYRRTAFASYVAYALSHSIGVSTLSGGGVRYRLYSSWGLSATDVAKVVMFNGITFWTGFSFVGAAIFILRPMPVPPGLHLPIPSDFYVGLICLLAVSSYLFVCALRKRPVKIFGLELQVPPFSLCFAQISISSLDWLIAGSVLFVLLRQDLHLPYLDFIGIFLFSQIAGLASQSPGGLGVFEVVALIMLSPYAPPSSVLGSLLVLPGRVLHPADDCGNPDARGAGGAPEEGIFQDGHALRKPRRAGTRAGLIRDSGIRRGCGTPCLRGGAGQDVEDEYPGGFPAAAGG